MLFPLIIGIIFGGILSLLSLIPVFHVNNILPAIESFPISTEIKVPLLISFATIFSFLVFIPAVIFLVPTSSNYASMPAIQKLYNKGQAYYAIYLASIGGLYGIIFGLPIIALFIALIKIIDPIVGIITPIVLILTLLFLASSIRKYDESIIFGLSCFAGLLALSSPLNIINPILPLIAGFFGLSQLTHIIFNKSIKINQEITVYKKSLLTKAYIGITSSALSVFVTLFPGIGSGIATYLGAKINKFEDENYIMLNGAINTLVIVLSFISAVTIYSARTGSGLVLKEIAKNSIFESLLVIIPLVLFSSIIGIIVTLIIGKKLVLLSNVVHRKTLGKFSLLILITTIIFNTNLLGYLVFILAGSIGYLAIKTNSKRILMISSISFALLISFFI